MAVQMATKPLMEEQTVGTELINRIAQLNDALVQVLRLYAFAWRHFFIKS